MQPLSSQNTHSGLDYDPNDFISNGNGDTCSLITTSVRVHENSKERPMSLMSASPLPSKPQRCPYSVAQLQAMKKHPRIGLSTFGVKRHNFFNPAAAAKYSASYLDMTQFGSATSYQTMQAMMEANPLIPASLMGCGRDNQTSQKKIHDPHFRAEYSFLENVDFCSLVEMVEKMHPKHRNYCTMVLPDKPVHVYLDFDAGADADKPHKHAMYVHVQGKEVEVQRELRQR